MIALFSRLMDRAVDFQFRKDPSGRSVFLPLGSRGKAYFVGTAADEQKIKSFVKMYKSTSTLISLLTFPSVYIPGVMLADFAGLSPKFHVFRAGAGRAASDSLGRIQSDSSGYNVLADRGRT
jgi:hypothetical protein